VALEVIIKGRVYGAPHMLFNNMYFLLYPSSSCRTLQNEVKKEKERKDKENKMILYIYEIIIS